MTVRHPRHPSHLSQDLDSISLTFLEQFALVFNNCQLLSAILMTDHLRHVCFHANQKITLMFKAQTNLNIVQICRNTVFAFDLHDISLDEMCKK